MGCLYLVRGNVRDLLQDNNPDTPVFPDARVNAFIGQVLQTKIGNQVNPGETWTAAAVTLVSGTSDYTMTGAQYAQLRVLRLDSIGRDLQRVSAHEMEVFRQGPSPASGLPMFYFAWEDTYGLVHLRLYPTPNASDTLSRLAAVLPTTLHDDAWVISSGTISASTLTAGASVDTFDLVRANDVITGMPSYITDSTYVTAGGSASITISNPVLATFATTRLNFSAPIPLSDPLLRALEAEAAALCIETADQSMMDKLSLNPQFAGTLHASSDRGIYWEKVRRSRQQSTETVARGW